MRSFLAATLAAPALALVVARSLGHRAGRRRTTAIIAVLAVGLLSVYVGSRPAATTATLPTGPVGVPTSEFNTVIETSESPAAPVSISFPAPMNEASVAQMLRIAPVATVEVAWDETGTLLTVRPRTSWRPGTYYTITVEAGALDAEGRPTERRLRSAFLTRPPVTGSLSATAVVDGEATIATTFRAEFSGPIDESTLDFLIDPPVEGEIVPDPSPTDTAPAFEFIPADPLDPGTDYRVQISTGTLDADGAAIEVAPLSVTTAAVPAVVRFRPRNGWSDVARGQDLSVRFTEPMDHASTEAAWSAVQGTTTLSGSFRWAENDTVLVFNPKDTLGYSQKVTMTVGTGALSRAGLPLQSAASASFTTIPKPKPSTSGGGGSSGSSGGSIGGSTWAAVESYYLGLMNCTRTGGWVTSTGSCSSPGGRNVAPLWQDAGITAKVSRPYAKKLAVNNVCSHFSGGTPGDRLRAAGYSSYVWAENLGCRSGDPYAAVLGSHLFFQSEKSYNGGHYVNLMNAKYDRVGIGVWVSGGRVRLVVDFYHPL